MGEGQRQSPIDIITAQTKPDAALEASPLEISYDPKDEQVIGNTGEPLGRRADGIRRADALWPAEGLGQPAYTASAGRLQHVATRQSRCLIAEKRTAQQFQRWWGIEQ